MAMIRLFFAAAFVAMLTITPAVQASVYTLDAVEDTFLGESNPNKDTTYNGLGISIKKSSPKEVSLYQFDLSGLDGNILSAHVELYDLGTGGTDAFSFDHYFLTPSSTASDAELTFLNTNNDVAFDQDGMHAVYATYNSYGDAAGSAFWTESANSTMPLSIDADNTVNQYYASDDADATGLGILNDNMNGKGYVILLGWHSVGNRMFADSEAGFAPRLVVETAAVPEPATITLLLTLGLAGIMLIRRRK